MISIGGSGYRWRGKSIRTIQHGGAPCATMPRKDSIIRSPVVVQMNTKYKVVITASRSDGTGDLLLNFFGGISYDGSHVGISVVNSGMSEYTAVVTTPKFPSSFPMYFRIWRPPNSAGSVIIKAARISVLQEGEVISAKPVVAAIPPPQVIKNKKVPRPKSVTKSPSRIVKRKPPVQLVRPQVKENRIMKFKPYNNKRTTAKGDEVIVSSKSDVPMVSIITPTRDGEQLLRKCYAALNENTSYPNWEWIVGDSDSSDDTVKFLKELKDPRIKIVERGHTGGSFSTINNELVLQAAGEYLLFLNDDTEPGPFWLYEMVSKIHRHDDIGIVGAKLLYSPGKIQHAGVAFMPNGPANIGKSVLRSFSPGFQDHDRYYQAVTAACMLMRREDFDKVNGFDPIYHFCYEDIDLCLKVKYNLGKKIMYAARAEVIHSESVTQKKYKTGGDLQGAGIAAFKERWMNKVELDFLAYQKDPSKGKVDVDVSFVTCVNNLQQFSSHVYGSLLKSETKRNYEILGILNFGNIHSAAGALNIGIEKASSDIVVLCHQDVIFYKEWVDMLFDRIDEIEGRGNKWGVLGTAGITSNDVTVGVVHSIKGSLQWQPTKRKKVHDVQTVDEHCMIIRKSSGLRFDSKTFDGFHLYGADICLSAISKGYTNFGILCPIIHASGSGSLVSGRADFMRHLNALADKWRSRFQVIRTPTSVIRKKSLRTFIKFKG